MGELHTHACPECYEIVRCELGCTVERQYTLPVDAEDPGALPEGSVCVCEACDVTYRYGAPFQEGLRVVAADTAYVYEVLSISPSHLKPFGKPGWLAAELRSVPGYPDDHRTVTLDRDRRPIDYGDEHTSWELAKKP